MTDGKLESLLSGLGIKRVDEWVEASPQDLYRLGKSHRALLGDALKEIGEAQRREGR